MLAAKEEELESKNDESIFLDNFLAHKLSRIKKLEEMLNELHVDVNRPRKIPKLMDAPIKKRLLQDIGAPFNAPSELSFKCLEIVAVQNEVKEEPIAMQEPVEQIALIQVGETLGFEPHYLPRNLKFWALGRDQIPTTIFSTFANNSAELVEQLDLSQEFESLINENSSLSTLEQSARVADARRELNLQAFEVRFAVHRLVLRSSFNASDVDSIWTCCHCQNSVLWPQLLRLNWTFVDSHSLSSQTTCAI
jgi:hypothetical protein